MNDVDQLPRYSIILLIVLITAPLALGLGPVTVVRLAADALRNNEPLRSGTPVRTGDSLRTSREGSLTLAVGSEIVEFGHKTDVQVMQRGVRLRHGYIRVAGAIEVEEDGHSVLPSGADADFELVRLLSGRCYIHVFSGSVRLTGFAVPVRMAAGKTITYAVQDQQQPPASEQKQTQEPAPATPEVTEQQTTTTTTTTTSTEVVPPIEGGGARPAATVPTDTAVAAIVGAAIVAGLIAYCLTAKPNASPTAP